MKPVKPSEPMSSSRYREYLKLLPDFKKENTRLITMLIFTFAALSFFGIFAINPTLSTIVELHKKLADSEAVHEQLSTKINNLSQLQQQYTQIEKDLSLVNNAIPENANVPISTGQIRALAKKYNLQIVTLRINEVLLASPNLSKVNVSSFVFNLEAKGDYDDMISFASAVTDMSRVITIESLVITKDTKSDALIIQLRGREYFKK